MNATAVRSILAELNASTSIVDAASTCVDAFAKSAWPGVAWRWSNLTTDGCPLEFSFSTRDEDVRFACEVGPPEMPTVERIAAAVDLAARLGAPAVPSERLSEWQAAQSFGHLRWGAWLGVRAAGDQTRVKIYVETPAEARDSSVATANRPILDSGRLKMIGYDCSTRACELYYRQPQMNAAELHAFTQFVDAAPQRRSMLEAFARLCALPKHIALQWVNFGYSLVDAGGFALFVRDRSIGSRGRIRACFLESQAAFGNASSAYAAA
ncbi:MAG TPA: hypothetical protein VGK84_02600, partial [Candidatus Tumulicola sp.]